MAEMTFVRARDIARVADLSIAGVMRAVHEGRLRAVKIGRCYFIPLESAREFVGARIAVPRSNGQRTALGLSTVECLSVEPHRVGVLAPARAAAESNPSSSVIEVENEAKEA
jgi:hypothetical protein